MTPAGTLQALIAICVTLAVTGVTTQKLAAQDAPAPPDYIVTVHSAHAFDETVDMLKSAIEEQNLMVIHEINPQQMLRMVGVRTGGMKQILFFHPRYMRQILETDRNAGIEPPLKVLAMEAPNGSVMVRYVDPVYQFGRYTGLDEIAVELKGIVETIVAAVQ